MHRVKLSLKPIGGDRDFLDKIKDNPDFYGPFWIMATWVVLLSIAVITWSYLEVFTFTSVYNRYQDK